MHNIVKFSFTQQIVMTWVWFNTYNHTGVSLEQFSIELSKFSNVLPDWLWKPLVALDEDEIEWLEELDNRPFNCEFHGNFHRFVEFDAFAGTVIELFADSSDETQIDATDEIETGDCSIGNETCFNDSGYVIIGLEQEAVMEADFGDIFLGGGFLSKEEINSDLLSSGSREEINFSHTQSWISGFVKSILETYFKIKGVSQGDMIMGISLLCLWSENK